MRESIKRPPVRRERLDTGGRKPARKELTRRERVDVRPRLLSDTNPTWVKAPFLLFRFPGVLLAVVAAAIVLGVASVSSPVFLSSAGSAAIAKQRETISRQGQGLTVIAYLPIAGGGWHGQDRILNETVSTVPQLEAPILTVLGSQAAISNADGTGRPAPVRIATRTGFLSNIQVVRTSGGQGVWVPDTAARLMRIRPGDTIVVKVRKEATRVRVAGTYRNLAFTSLGEFWQPIQDLIRPQDEDVPAPPPFLLADVPTLERVEKNIGDLAQFRWEYWTKRDRLTLDQGAEVSNGLASVETQLDDPVSAVGSQFQSATHESFMSSLVDKAQLTVASLRSSVDTLSLAGRIVALVVLAAVGIYSVGKRRIEMGLLSARGVSPLSLGGRSALEALLPAAAGAAIGWFGGIWLVRLLGPSDLIATAARQSAIRQVVWTTSIALILLGIVAAVAVRSESETRNTRFRGAVSKTPWELVVLALAGAAFYEITTRGSTTVTSLEGPPRVDVFILLFPILFVAGLAGVATRLLRRTLPKLRSAGTKWSPPMYLASRRLASASRMALLLITASALSIGILAYAGILVSSVSDTADAKALVFTGSDVDATLLPNAKIPAGLPFPVTKVARLQGNSFLLPGEIDADILGIDRSTFADAAFWSEDFGDQSMQELVALLKPDPSSPRLPAILAGAGFPENPVLGLTNYRVPLQVVATVRAFPGMLPKTQLVIADAGALEKAFNAADTTTAGAGGFEELWARGEPDRVIPALSRAGVRWAQVVTADEVRESPALLALSWTFGFLEALGVMAGLIVFVGLLLYLQARQRSREVSYALARRMGLRRLSHLLSVAIELMAMLLAAFFVGVVLAGVGARLIYGRLDPIPGIPPAPLLRFPMLVLAITGAVLLVAAWLGAWRVQRAADHANVAEVLRAAG